MAEAVACFGPQQFWVSSNAHPESAEGKMVKKRKDSDKLLSVRYPDLCPHSDIIDICATIVGKDYDEVVGEEHYCGSWMGESVISPFLMGQRSGVQTMCREIAQQLGQMLQAVKTKRPSKKELSNLVDLEPSVRDAILARLDRHREGIQHYKQFRKAVLEMQGLERASRKEVLFYVEHFYQGLLDQAAGNHEVFTLRLCPTFNCEQAPKPVNDQVIKT